MGLTSQRHADTVADRAEDAHYQASYYRAIAEIAARQCKSLIDGIDAGHLRLKDVREVLPTILATLDTEAL